MALLERERNEKERQAKLKEAYEKKMQMKENLVERKQTIPQFDRAAKPTGVLSDYNHNVQREVQRDFAPVYGSVVSTRCSFIHLRHSLALSICRC